MTSNSCLLTRVVPCLIVGAALPLAAFGQSVLKTAPPPRDPLELVNGQVQLADSPASREAALQLLTRARKTYALRSAGQPYDLKVSFSVDSGGQTNYDGDWQMEDRFAPGEGLRWTATSASGYSITQISRKKVLYGEGTASAIPLRLQEARGALFDPIPSPGYASLGSIRTATATLHNATLTCVMLSRSKNASIMEAGRSWEESEECIDPQTGLLQVHSEAPGKYAVYDWTNGPQIGGYVLPHGVTISEGGRVVSRITIESLQANAAFDPNLFVPTDGMKGRPETTMGPATKILRVQLHGAVSAAATVRPVCVFGMVTPNGHLVEAHSLQPADPNSDAAVKDATAIDFSPTMAPGSPPRQHFVFVIERFVSQQ